MMHAEFQPSLFSTPEKIHTENPMVKVEMWRRDHSNIYLSQVDEWTKSNSQIYTQNSKGATITGLHKGRTLTSAYLTQTIDISESGEYWVLLRVSRNAGNKDGSIGLEIDGELVKTISTYSKWTHYRFLDFGHLQLTNGEHSFKVLLNGKSTWVDHLLMYRLEYFSSDETDSLHRLDWKNIEFTENALGDINSAEITLSLKEGWNDPNSNIYSRKLFDYVDIVNIIVGNDWKDAKVKFGGYVIGIEEEDDNSEITLLCADRLLDLYRRPVYTNYYIGVSPASDETYTFPRVKFGSGLEAIRHASETSEYGPLNYGIVYPYALDLDFRIQQDYDQVQVSGFTKTYSQSTGLRLGYDKLVTNHCGVTPDLSCSGILFDDPYNPIDAAINEILCIKYLASGESCGENNRVQFNIEVSMFKQGQDPGDAQTYTILWTGKRGASKIIGQATPVLDGTDQLLKFDWNQAFDKYASSSNYYVTKIELVDVATAEQVKRRENSSINILELISYNSDLNTKMKVNQETSYPYEVISEIIGNMDYVAFMDYGRYRREDILCMAPEMNEESLVQAVQGVNVLNVTDKSYEPRETIRNAILSHYHYKSGKTEKTGVSYQQNLDSIARYGPGAWETYEDRTDVSKKTDADLLGKKYVMENSYPIVSFTMELKGTSLLNPSQFIVTSLEKEYLEGNYSTQTATHSISRDGGYITKISVNRPGSYYNQIMMKLEENMTEFLNKHSDSMYSRNVLTNMGFSSLGAFIRGGY